MLYTHSGSLICLPKNFPPPPPPPTHTHTFAHRYAEAKALGEKVDFIKVSAMVRHMSFGWAGMKFYIVAEQQVLIVSCIAMSSQFGIIMQSQSEGCFELELHEAHVPRANIM